MVRPRVPALAGGLVQLAIESGRAIVTAGNGPCACAVAQRRRLRFQGCQQQIFHGALAAIGNDGFNASKSGAIKG
jgi:hypothetical protein